MKATDKEHWFVAEIYTKKSSELYRFKLFKFISKILSNVDSINFHFFHEDWDKTMMSEKILKKWGHLFPKEKKGCMFLFRVKSLTKEGINNIHKEFDKHKYLIKGIYKKIKFPEYHGEEKYYSKQGWLSIQEYFYECSCIAILLSYTDLKKAEWLNASKLIHTFLNQLGYGTGGEFNFHLDRAIKIYRSFKLSKYAKKEIKEVMDKLNKIK